MPSGSWTGRSSSAATEANSSRPPATAAPPVRRSATGAVMSGSSVVGGCARNPRRPGGRRRPAPGAIPGVPRTADGPRRASVARGIRERRPAGYGSAAWTGPGSPASRTSWWSRPWSCPAQVSVWTADAPARSPTTGRSTRCSSPWSPSRSTSGGQRPLLVLLLVLGASWLQFELGGEAFQPWFAVAARRSTRVGAHARPAQALVGAAATAVGVLAVDVPQLAAGRPGGRGAARLVRPRRHLGSGPVDPPPAARDRGPGVARAATAERERAEQAARAVAEERAPHRPRTARPRRAQHGRHRHPGAGRAARASTRDRTPPGAALAVDRDARAGRGWPRCAGCSGCSTSPEDSSVSPQPGLARPADAGRPAARGRTAGRTSDRRRAGRSARRRRPGRLPHRAGGADQRAQARRPARRPRSSSGAAGGAVEVEVCDDGRGQNGPRAAGGGHGLVGMRERAALYGGHGRGRRTSRAAATGCAPGCWWTGRRGDDPGPGRRRRGAGAHRAAADPRRRARPQRRRHGGRRAAGGRGGAAAAARTSSSWTSGCPGSTGWRRPGAS